ncbi:hexokinase-domain-containing protein [Mycotypha africana]|uniref:hexokinase-domain-containing protein n=1 Tax=Mycotypha africana TaxID=64632 RepID=UPI00230045F8|nr:hexokinase-domain-containing protein [Mycotypha africana]KAI8975199.1 hexokinase-domain-containing protein [Mycotypha africana]
MDKRKQDILSQIEQAFRVTDEQLNKLVEGINEEMRNGLNKLETATKTSELKMIPSYVTGYPNGFEKGTYLALEISGVDIYVCQVKLKGEGGKLAINQYQYKIPDNLTAGDDITILIDYVADCVTDFQQRVGAHQHIVYSMAISIGFAVVQTGLDKGKIIALEHGFDFPNVIGCDAVDLFDKRFKAKGLAVKIVAIANDGVCTLLAHAYQHPSTRIGIIHSAGTNCAYYDKMSNIGQFKNRLKHQQQEDMIINTEWCNFGARHLPKTKFDDLLDIQSNNPGIHIFEKMTTGMYLGEIVRQVLVYLVDEGVLSFTSSNNINSNANNRNNSCDTINSNSKDDSMDMDAEDGDIDEELEGECLLTIPYQFDTSYMYVCEADEDDDDQLEDTRLILEDMCRVGETSVEDRKTVKKVCEWVGQRAALLLGASIASVVKYMVEDGIGLDSEKGFAIGKPTPIVRCRVTSADSNSSAPSFK